MKFYDETKPLNIETDASWMDWELLFCKPEATQAAPGIECQTTVYSDPLYLLAEVRMVLKKDTAT